MNNPGKQHFYSKDVPGHLVQRAISLLLRVQSTNYLCDGVVTECKIMSYICPAQVPASSHWQFVRSQRAEPMTCEALILYGSSTEL